MQITDIQIKKVYNDPLKAVKAKLSIVLDNEFIIHDVKVIEKVTDGYKKKFISFPSQVINAIDENNNPISSRFDIVHPINGECRVKFEKAIYDALDSYNEQV